MAKGKTGGDRRDPEKAAFWRRVVREQAASGLCVREFCRAGKLSEASFYHWRRELRTRRLEAKGLEAQGRERTAVRPRSRAMPERSMPFAEVRLPERLASEIEIRRGEVSVFFRGGCEGALLREALRLLGGTPC
jgi:transposase-like protein